MFSQYDYHTFQLVNHLAISESNLNPLMTLLSQDGEYLFFLGILVYWFFRSKSNRRMVVEGLIAACIALGINGVIGLFLYRDRPFVHHHVIQLIHHAANASFPSDHATGAFVIAVSIWIWRKKDGMAWTVLAAAIAISRIWTGVHYPTDVIAGILIGTFVALLTHRILTGWEFADRTVNGVVAFYEKIERKVWRGNGATRI